jgi:hypothetical protein
MNKLLSIQQLFVLYRYLMHQILFLYFRQPVLEMKKIYAIFNFYSIPKIILKLNRVYRSCSIRSLTF